MSSTSDGTGTTISPTSISVASGRIAPRARAQPQLLVDRLGRHRSGSRPAGNDTIGTCRNHDTSQQHGTMSSNAACQSASSSRTRSGIHREARRKAPCRDVAHGCRIESRCRTVRRAASRCGHRRGRLRSARRSRSSRSIWRRVRSARYSVRMRAASASRSACVTRITTSGVSRQPATRLQPVDRVGEADRAPARSPRRRRRRAPRPAACSLAIRRSRVATLIRAAGCRCRSSGWRSPGCRACSCRSRSPRGPWPPCPRPPAGRTAASSAAGFGTRRSRRRLRRRSCSTGALFCTPWVRAVSTAPVPVGPMLLIIFPSLRAARVPITHSL